MPTGMVLPPPGTTVPNYLVFAILATVFCCLPAGIPGIIYAAQVNTKLQAGDYAGAVIASNNAKTWCWVSFGIVLGYVGVALTAFLIGLGIYAQHTARKAVTHSTIRSGKPVVSAIRTLNTAEIAYAQAHKSLGYTCSLSDLSNAWGIGNLSEGHAHGYVFELKDCKASKGTGPVVMYRLVAYPATQKPGAAAYCSDESDVIRVSRNGSAEDCLRTGTDLEESEIKKSGPVWQTTQ